MDIYIHVPALLGLRISNKKGRDYHDLAARVAALELNLESVSRIVLGKP